MKIKEVSKRIYHDPKSKVIDKKTKYTKLIPRTPNKWSRKERKTKNVFLVWLLVASFIFFLSSIGVAIFINVFGTDRFISSDKVDILIQGQGFVEQENLSSFVINVVNRNPVDMTTANLIVSFPQGVYTTDFGEVSFVPSKVYNLGGIKSKESKNVSVDTYFFGEENEKKTIKIELEYKISGSISLFRVPSEYSVLLRQPPIQLSELETSSTVSGKETKISLTINSNTIKTYNSVLVRAKYPDNFIINKTFPETLRGTNSTEWQFNNFQAGGTKTIEVYGVITGKNRLEQSIKFDAFISPTKSLSTASKVSSSKTFFFVEEPFVDVSIRLSQGEIAESGRELRGSLDWSISDGLSYENLLFYIQFGGNALNESLIFSENGFYDGNRKRLIFDKNTFEDFEFVTQDSSGSFDFDFGSLLAIEDFAASERVIELSVGASGYETGSREREELNNLVTKTIKIRNEWTANIDSKYSNTLIENKGPIPPKVGEQTTYSISIELQNNGNDLEDVSFSIPLTKNVEFTRVVDGIEARNIEYIEEDHLIKFELDRVVGFGTGRLINVEFQVVINPSEADVGKKVLLTRDATFTAQDLFINEKYEVNLQPLSTEIPDSTSGAERVVR